MFGLSKKYFLSSLVGLSVLVYIALYVHDQFVRPFLGDVIVVIWLYLCLKAVVKINSYETAHFTLLFSYGIETAQYFNVVSILGLQHITPIRIIFGATFDWLDILAYTIGWGCIVFALYCSGRLGDS